MGYGMTIRELARFWGKPIPYVAKLIEECGVWVESNDTPLNTAQIQRINNRLQKRKQAASVSAASAGQAQTPQKPNQNINLEYGWKPKDNFREDDFELVVDKDELEMHSHFGESESNASKELVNDVEEEIEELEFKEEIVDEDEADEEGESTPKVQFNTPEKGANRDEKKAQAKLLQYVKRYYIFMDTSSLLNPMCKEFLSHLIPLLKQEDKKLYLPQAVLKELEEFANVNPKFSSYYQEIRMLINKMYYEDKVLSLRGEANDGRADEVFTIQFEQLRQKYPLLLVTENKTLAQNIVALNQLRAAKSFDIKVQKISKYGYCADFLTPPYYISKTVTNASAEPKIKPVPTIGDVVHTGNGQNITLRSRLSSGGEGVIYHTDTELVAKIYLPSQLSELRQKKLELMVSRKIVHDFICWPQEVLYDSDGAFVGYMMKEAQGLPFSQVLGPLYIQEEFPEWKKINLVHMAQTVIDQIVYLHSNNILLGDINLNNFLVEDEYRVYFVDTDSYQVNEFPCPVGIPEYTPAELQGKNFRTFMRTIANENFAVAVLLFMILMLGKKPYDKIDVESITTAIKEADFAYPNGKDSTGMAPVGPWRFLWSHFPRKLKEAFYQVFRKGEEHYLPEKRFSSKVWQKYMKLYENYLKLIQDQVDNPEKYKNLAQLNLPDSKSKKLDSMSLEMLPTRFKLVDPRECKCCHQVVASDAMIDAVICKACARKGSEFICKECGEKTIYTNYRKYVLKKAQPQFCQSCMESLKAEVYETRVCKSCNKRFTITMLQKREYELAGKSLPICCKECYSTKGKDIYTVRKCNVSNCGKLFSVTYGEKWALEEKGYKNPPSKCPECRKKGKKF